MMKRARYITTMSFNRRQALIPVVYTLGLVIILVAGILASRARMDDAATANLAGVQRSLLYHHLALTLDASTPERKLNEVRDRFRRNAEMLASGRGELDGHPVTINDPRIQNLFDEQVDSLVEVVRLADEHRARRTPESAAALWSATNALVRECTEAVGETGRHSRTAARDSQWIQLGVGLVVMLLGVFLALIISKSLSLPIRELVSSIEQTSTVLKDDAAEQQVETQEQLAAITETTSTTSELATSQSAVRERAERMAASSLEATDTIALGQDAIRNTIEGLCVIRDRTRTTNERIGDLSRRSEQVGKVIFTIKDVTDQINLLALNASIEAARAGEHGQGFGVVAAEVRKLAEKTQISTGEIEEIVGTMQDATSAAVLATEETLRSVAKGQDLAESTSAVFEDVVGVVSRTTANATEIRTACAEQDTATRQIVESMHRLSQGANRSSEMSAALTTSATELSEVSKRLLGVVA